MGEVLIEVTPMPHTGCAKFTQQFGAVALTFVNSATGRNLRLRGVNARILSRGVIKVGDAVVKH